MHKKSHKRDRIVNTHRIIVFFMCCISKSGPKTVNNARYISLTSHANCLTPLTISGLIIKRHQCIQECDCGRPKGSHKNKTLFKHIRNICILIG